MKNIITKINRHYVFRLLPLLICLISACSDILDSAPDGKISLEEVFQDDEKVAAFLNSCYQYVPGKGVMYYHYERGPVVWSDDAWDADAEREPTLASGTYYRGNSSAASHPILDNWYPESGNFKYWDRYWAAIRKCTYFINHIDNASVKQESNRKRWKAEAHLLRAFFYSELLQWFGTGLPLERETYPLDQDYSKIEKASYYETVQFLLDDCEVALETAELPWRITTYAEHGRFHKGVAEALKSRMSLFMASPLYNEGNNYWEEAYNITKNTLASLRQNGYDLYDRINSATSDDPNAFYPNQEAALFNEYFINLMSYTADPVDKETIFQCVVDHTQTLWFIDGIGGQSTYKVGTCPSQELVDAFETIDGEPILHLSQPYLDPVTHLQPNYNPASMYDPQNPYANRDPRFYATVYYNGSQRRVHWPFAETAASPENYPGGIGVRSRYICTYEGEPWTGIHPTKGDRTRTGYYQRKFLHPFAGQGNDIEGVAAKFYRMGELILNFAEAAAEYGRLDEARAAVNEVRNRVRMPELPADLSKEELILRIRNERRVELALEGNRYFDVRRWQSPDGDLEETDRWITAMFITRTSDTAPFTYSYRREPAAYERQCYSNKYLKLPIPMNEANIFSVSGVEWQNPGW
jgi:hypothetical protein